MSRAGENMRIAEKIFQTGIRRGQLPLLPVFAAGAAAGIAAMNMGKSIMLENTGLLDEYTLYYMKYMTVNSNALFCYVLKQRLESLVFLAVLSTTYLGLAVCLTAAFWYGMAGGAFVAALMLRYGLKGMLFAAVGIFPQYLLYVPAMAGMLFWCERLCRSIYFKHCVHKTFLLKQLFQLGMIVGVVLAGCFLESYINPYLVMGLLKIF